MIHLRKYGTYRHMSTIDVDMHVMKIQYIGPKYFKLRVVFVNRHNGIVYTPPCTVKLKREDLWKWDHVNTI